MRADGEHWRLTRAERISTRRIPRRGTDWLEDAAAWVLISLGLIGAALSIIAGMQVHGSLLERAQLESSARTPVRAVLLQDAPVIPSADDQENGPMVQVPVRWVDTDGTERVDEATVSGLWCGVRHYAFTRNRARWEREWAEVEPRWSGRALGGSFS